MWKRPARFALCTAALLGVVAVNRWAVAVNATTAALYLLLVVLGAATRWGMAEAIFASAAAVPVFNFFFLPPVGTFTIADPENWVALFAFLATAVTVSKLSANAKRRAEEALAGRNEISGLYELSRALLLIEGRDAIRQSVTEAARVLRIEQLAFFDAANHQVFGSIDESRISAAEMVRCAETGEPVLKPDATAAPVRMGTHIVGTVAFGSREIGNGVRDAVANLLAINYERASAVERAAAAEVARRNEEFRSSLLDGLAHDLKTPLTAIRSCITRLIQIPPRTEEVREELLAIVDQESMRLQASITEAIELASIESRELHLAPVTMDVAALVRAAINDGRDENRERYAVDVSTGLSVSGDPDLFRRALTQILENARKYAPAGSPIAVRAWKDGRHTAIEVMDRGPGIRADEMERIFEKFYRGRGQRNKVEGTGMGLAIAKAIVSAHGGRIYAENRFGGGAAIVMKLP